MKNLISLTVYAFMAYTSSIFGSRNIVVSMAPGNTERSTIQNKQAKKMKIIIGTRTFSATLFDNPTVTAFKSMLPLSINMEELNGNEKKYDLPRRLPTKAANPEIIRNGDLMLYGSSTLVLFYKGFDTPYSYTRIGKIDDPSGLSAALGSRSVTVTYELE